MLILEIAMKWEMGASKISKKLSRIIKKLLNLMMAMVINALLFFLWTFILGLRNLGNCYEKGIGCEKNIAKAVEYYFKATDKENAMGKMSLLIWNYLNDFFYVGILFIIITIIFELWEIWECVWKMGLVFEKTLPRLLNTIFSPMNMVTFKVTKTNFLYKQIIF